VRVGAPGVPPPSSPSCVPVAPDAPTRIEALRLPWMPCLVVPDTVAPSRPGAHVACASSRYFSEQASMRASPARTASPVAQMALTAAVPIAAGKEALLMVPGSLTILTDCWIAAGHQGMS